MEELNPEILGEYTTLSDGDYFVIRNFNKMRAFFMTVVSANNHWMFISSNGALTAGRINPDSAFFPYYTDDKITDSAGITGSKTIIRVQTEDGIKVWQPFNGQLEGFYNTTSNLYKNREGNKLVFEEVNHDLDIIFRYSWSFSEKYGIVKKSELINIGKDDRSINLLDGIQNILPFGIMQALQNERSTLTDAYKTAVWDDSKKLGIYSLSSMVVDKAEPSEALKATTVWINGIDCKNILLSSVQVAEFNRSGKIESEHIVKAEKGAFFVNSEFILKSKENKEWSLIGEVNQSSSDLAKLSNVISNNSKIERELEDDIWKNKQDLRKKIGLSDGIQLSKDRLGTGRHFSNVLFNIMRGGTYEDEYQIDTQDLSEHIAVMNKTAHAELQPILTELPDFISYHQLRYFLQASKHKGIMRYYLEYLPLSFSRRHGDPSRPWNYFSIKLKNEKGKGVKNYEGNWRDIFQNWEALAYSYPEYALGMISKFVNASSIDGYNPYRITKDGIDWEVVDPADPWSHIGYWGDHQVIYLTKLLEFSDNFHPIRLRKLLNQPIFSYANVPYRIKGYDAIVNDAKHTINFDFEVEKSIKKQVEKLGSDGKLVHNSAGNIVLVNLTEKLLVMILTKLYNFVPEGGIWLNTQRPEWNDANNALVGNGVSMVTLYYLHRLLKFSETLFCNLEKSSVSINKPVIDLMDAISRSFSDYNESLLNGFNDVDRRSFMDSVGVAGEHYRTTAYGGFTGEKRELTYSKLKDFLATARKYLSHSIAINKRKDGLFHSYNLLEFSSNKARISHLYKMLEGQVSVLSANYLSPKESVHILDALKSSDMFRADQYSYMLYPDRDLSSFVNKNNINAEDLENSRLADALLSNNNTSIIEKDINGVAHFNGEFHNSEDLENALDKLTGPIWTRLVRSEKKKFIALFEKVFNHKSFTGRSGAFYGYEGLGSIYWHMVSKLLLAIQENIYKLNDADKGTETYGKLVEHYFEVRAGIGINKSPKLYGAFPTDAYSHTPKHAGAKQPGMTGQVKEDIINRWAELGVQAHQGRLSYKPTFLRKSEFIDQEDSLSCYSYLGEVIKVIVPENGLGFTYCQTPVVYKIADNNDLNIFYTDGSSKKVEGCTLDLEDSKSVFKRKGKILRIELSIKEENLLP